jgi:hypothetical protein
MFETQNVGDWIPSWLQRWRPLLFGLLITPFALLLGISDFGPEGPHTYVGYFIFPYSAFLYLSGALADIDLFLYAALAVALLQFPIYGFFVSWVAKIRTAFLIFGLSHASMVLINLIVFIILRLFLRPYLTGNS